MKDTYTIYRRRATRLPALVALILLTTATALLAVASPSSAASASYYVDRTVACSDTGLGTSATPYCTITKGVAALRAGDTLFIGNGTYAETIKPLVSGTNHNPVTVTRWPGRSPTIGTGATYGAYVVGRSYVVVSDLTFTDTVIDGIYVSGSDHVTISGNTVTAAGDPRQGGTAPGISLRSSSASTVSGNTSDHNSSHGFYVAGTASGNTIEGNEASLNAEGWQRNAVGIDVLAPGNTVLRNVVHDNEDSGLQFSIGGDNNLATLNVSYNNGDHGIDNFNVTGGRLIGNTVYRNCTSGINVEGTSGNYTVKNNVAVDNAVYPAYNGISCSRRAGNIGIWDSAPATTTVDHNLVQLTKAGTMYAFKSAYTSLAAMQTATGQEASGVQADPKFASVASGDFRLTAGSPAIDRGDSGVSGEQSQDLLGNPRVDDPATPNTFASGSRRYDDLGAYELQGGSNTAPTARLTVSPSTGTAPLQVTADASASTDPQGQALTYKFAFGDGTPNTGPQSGATTTHTYTSPGTYTLTVTATDTGGLAGSTTRTVTVGAATNSAPTARLTVSPSTGTAPLQVTADASASTDPEGQALTYKFAFGDGTPTTGPQSGATTTHTYTSPGSYTLTVTATDTGGLTSSATTTVTATTATTNTAPTARLTVTPSTGTAPLQVTADASTSSDPQGQALTYTFTFGDGTPNAGPQSSATTTHTYTSPGTYTLTVKATDTGGLTSTAATTVTANATTTSPPAFVNSIANNYSTSTKTSGYITVWRTAGVAAGDFVVLTLQLSGTTPTGTVTATDTAGNTYTQSASVADASGNRLVLVSGVATRALVVNDRITATFPSATSYRMAGDEFAGATRLDKTGGGDRHRLDVLVRQRAGHGRQRDRLRCGVDPERDDSPFLGDRVAGPRRWRGGQQLPRAGLPAPGVGRVRRDRHRERPLVGHRRHLRTLKRPQRELWSPLDAQRLRARRALGGGLARLNVPGVRDRTRTGEWHAPGPLAGEAGFWIGAACRNRTDDLLITRA